MNKPVAWMFEKDGAYMCIKHDSRVNYDGGIPLYTHPANLTDEERYTCFHQYFVLGEPKPTHYEMEYEDLIDFAKAILRKASEK